MLAMATSLAWLDRGQNGIGEKHRLIRPFARQEKLPESHDGRNRALEEWKLEFGPGQSYYHAAKYNDGHRRWQWDMRKIAVRL